MSTSGRYHARQSSELLPDQLVLNPTQPKRAALKERSQSQINQNHHEQPTIRLVESDSSSPTTVYDKTPFPNLPSQVLKPPRTTKHGYTVQNDGAFPSLDAKIRERSQSPKRSSKLFPHLTLKKSNRVSSSTTTSNAETLLNDSLYSPTSHRFSTEGTLRNTPTPGLQEREERERERNEALDAFDDQVQEGPSTIRPVYSSSGDSESTERASNSRDSDHGDQPAFEHSVHPAFRQADLPLRREKLSDIESVETRGSSGLAGSSPQDPSSEYSSHHSSSPPNPNRSNSANIIKYANSEDSMSVQYPEVRPPTGLSQSADSWTATDSDSLPPLSVQRKRQHMYSASAGPTVHPDRPLSTIASESEPSSRTHTWNRSSYGSGDMLRTPPRQYQIRHRRAQTTGSSSHSSPKPSSNYESILSERDESDRDLSGFSVMRSQSAVPVPLFSSSSSAPAFELARDKSSKDMREEQDDTIAELQAPPLRTKRSGYGLSRRRSTSDPPPGSARSNQTLGDAADRTSQGSFIFPQWAKQFYRGKAQLASANASRTSLSRPESQAFPPRSPMRMMPWAHHRRFESGWESYATGETGFTHSRPGTSRSGFPGYRDSPAGSSHFLPSIFRPYTPRRRAYTDITQPSDEFYDESDSSPSHSRINSMEITPAPPRHAVYQPSPLGGKQRNKKKRQRQRGKLTRDTTFVSSHRYASTGLSSIRPYGTPPHLAPSRRLSHRISTWRAPSFDEALSSLVKTRQNRQILFFCLGFVCPVLWMVAAVLPIPPRPLDPRRNEFIGAPEMGEDGAKTEMGRFTLDLQMEMFDWEQERRHLKARWWRNLNRVMSVIGVGVVVAIIVLAVLASK